MLFSPKPLNLPPSVHQIALTLHEQGYQCYVVGGAVRDGLRGLTPDDWDIATDALPDQIQQSFARTIPTGKKFGTITVVVGNDHIEVTTLRKEGRYTDHRHPDDVVYTTNLQEDLLRRDFSVNAIAFDPTNQIYQDPYHGIKDLRAKVLKTVGNPQARFNEDPLRMLRLVRFMATLGFRPAKQTADAISPSLLAGVSWERIRDELSKLLLAAKLDTAFELMYTSGIMEHILPELATCAHVLQGNRHKWDVLGHSIISAQVIKPVLHLRLAALFHDIGKPTSKFVDDQGIHFYQHDQHGAEIVRQILKRLRYGNSTINQVYPLVRWHMFPIHPRSSDKAIRRFIAKVGKTAIYDLLELRRADILAMRFDAQQALAFIESMQARIDSVLQASQVFTLHDLAITGSDLIDELQITPGPVIGDILNYLLEQVLATPELNNQRQLLQLAKEYYRGLTEVP